MWKLSSLSTRQRTVAVVCIVVAAIAASFTVPRFFVLSLTASLHKRLYLIDDDTSRIRCGDFVLFRHSSVATRGIEQTMVKHVRCDEGDELVVDRNKVLTCNGEYIGRAKDTALNGMKLQHFVWNGKVPAGMFLPMGEHKDSFDGRYYGFISKAKVLKKAHPVF
ncbi:MAG: peptidase [Deltaproteobacteria bacterium]|nr:peptidase [Deltaproteobacteria bacterium]